MTPVTAKVIAIRSKRVEIDGKTYWIRRWVYRLSDGADGIGVRHECQVLRVVGKKNQWVAMPDFERNKALCDAAWGDYP